jgi:hypothetical protein
MDWSYTPPSNNTVSGGGPIAMTSIPIDFSIAANQQYFHKLSGVELPVPAGGYQVGGMIDFLLRRNPADTADTYPNDAIFLQFAMHVPTDGDGSRQRYTK